MLYNYYIFKCMLKALIKKIDILKNQSTVVVLDTKNLELYFFYMHIFISLIKETYSGNSNILYEEKKR